MARDDLHFRLRIPEDLKARIENAAHLNERSMTAEIIARLQWTFGPADEEMTELLQKQAAAESRADVLLSELQARNAEVSKLRDRQAKTDFELRVVREKLAKAEGAVASMETTIDILFKHMAANYEGGMSEMLERVMNDLDSHRPTRKLE